MSIQLPKIDFQKNLQDIISRITEDDEPDIDDLQQSSEETVSTSIESENKEDFDAYDQCKLISLIGFVIFLAFYIMNVLYVLYKYDYTIIEKNCHYNYSWYYVSLYIFVLNFIHYLLAKGYFIIEFNKNKKYIYLLNIHSHVLYLIAGHHTIDKCIVNNFYNTHYYDLLIYHYYSHYIIIGFSLCGIYYLRFCVTDNLS